MADEVKEMTLTDYDRNLFWSKVDKTAPNGCWQWKGRPQGWGYGQFCIKRRTYRAHRISLMIHGIDLIKGLYTDHLCKNKMCVNPQHLEQVTHKENTLRGTCAAAINAKKTHCKHGHEFTKENTNVRRVAVGAKTYSYRQCITCYKFNYQVKYNKRAALDGEGQEPSKCVMCGNETHACVCEY